MHVELQPSQVVPGAVLELDGRPRRVIGSLRFDRDGVRWGEHCIESRAGQHEWLSIRPGDELTVAHWTPRYDLFGEPDRDGVTMDGREWGFDDAGHATYTAQGDTGTGSTGSCDYVEFVELDEADGSDGLLVFESFDGGVWEISVGRRVDPALVRAYREVAGA